MLVDKDSAVIQEFTYDDTGDDWHPTTDGDGYSLVLLDPSGPTADWNLGSKWRASHEQGGSPGEADLIRGDLDANERVDLTDLAIFQSHFGTSFGAQRADGDLNRDGAVNRKDLALLAMNYGRSYTTPAMAASPAAPPVATDRLQKATLTATRRPVRLIGAAATDTALEGLLPTSRGAARRAHRSN